VDGSRSEIADLDQRQRRRRPRRPGDGGHVLRHVGKDALTNPKLMRRDQPTLDPPTGPNRMLPSQSSGFWPLVELREMPAPRPVIVHIEVPGAKGAWRHSKPDYRRHKARREPWRPREHIPQLDVDSCAGRSKTFAPSHGAKPRLCSQLAGQSQRGSPLGGRFAALRNLRDAAVTIDRKTPRSWTRPRRVPQTPRTAPGSRGVCRLASQITILASGSKTRSVQPLIPLAASRVTQVPQPARPRTLARRLVLPEPRPYRANPGGALLAVRPLSATPGVKLGAAQVV
jgi:hypothetical protein